MRLGPEVPDQSALTCSRELAGPENRCGRPATHHIIWDRNVENSLACTEHAIEGEPFGAVQVHSVIGSDCGMPGSFWNAEDARCYMEVLSEEPTLREAVGSAL